MKRILILTLVLCIFMSSNAFAFGGAETDTVFLDSLNRDVTDDVKYLENIAFAFGDRYVVTQEEYIDISSIDKYYELLSRPLLLKELDNGKLDFDAKCELDDSLKKEINLFKIIGGLSGCRATFVPVCAFNIYRNITLVGGYSKYERTYENADDAYWRYICNVQYMTKEIVPYHTRLAYLEKTRQMYKNMDSDNRFKVFLLVDGKVNSVWERFEDEE